MPVLPFAIGVYSAFGQQMVAVSYERTTYVNNVERKRPSDGHPFWCAPSDREIGEHRVGQRESGNALRRVGDARGDGSPVWSPMQRESYSPEMSSPCSGAASSRTYFGVHSLDAASSPWNAGGSEVLSQGS